MKAVMKKVPGKDAEMQARYKKKPYLIIFDNAEKIGVFEFFKDKQKGEFLHLSDIYEYCLGLCQLFKDGKQNARRAIKSFDQTFSKVWPPAEPPEGAANQCRVGGALKRYPLSSATKKSIGEPRQTLYFLMICLSTEETGFFKKKGDYFSKGYDGEVKESNQFKIVESGLLNHLFDLKYILDFSRSHKYFFEFDKLILDHGSLHRSKALSGKLFTEEGRINDYFSGLARLAYSQLPEFLAICDLSGYKTILDIGSGACIYNMGILDKYKETRIFGLDFDIVNKWRIEKKYDEKEKDQESIGRFIDTPKNQENLNKRFTFVNIPTNKKDAIFNEETWNMSELQNRNFDCILIQNFFHHNAKNDGEWLLRQCYNKLILGGKIIVQDYFKTIDESAPFAAVIFSLYFRSISFEGQTYSRFELSNMLFNAGFRKIKCQKISELSFLIEAYKEGESKKVEYFVGSILKKLKGIKYPIKIKSIFKQFKEVDFRIFYSIDYITKFKEKIKIKNSKQIKKLRLMSKEMIECISNPNFNNKEDTYWCILFFLSIMDSPDLKKLYSDHNSIFYKIIENPGLDLTLRIFFLFLFFVEDLPFSSKQIKQLKEEYYTISKGLQHYFGANSEACKMNLIRCLIEKDRMKDPTSFIYIFSLRLFLEYEILDSSDYDYCRLVEEFSENREELVREEVSNIKKSLREE